eukprot:TRINITY_DN7258_c0_g2_i2.p2 TRINITY_DN7258_c0_g2~~TRINITY_DN7258_c0_g2_i2.p2  ORF type:complete len:166 (-),score=36.31 TRINITY_DN7258_c0_g2_i2:101-598(-)
MHPADMYNMYSSPEDRVPLADDRAAPTAAAAAAEAAPAAPAAGAACGIAAALADSFSDVPFFHEAPQDRSQGLGGDLLAGNAPATPWWPHGGSGGSGGGSGGGGSSRAAARIRWFPHAARPAHYLKGWADGGAILPPACGVFVRASVLRISRCVLHRRWLRRRAT